MKTALIPVALIFLLAIPARAERVTYKAGPPKCTAKGSPIVEIDLVDDTASAPQDVVKLYANGTTTTVTTVDKKVESSTQRCLGDAVMKMIRADLKAARWKVTRAGITCRAYSARSMIVKINGRKLFTQRTCGTEAIDATSEEKLAEIKKLMQLPNPMCEDNPLAENCP